MAVIKAPRMDPRSKLRKVAKRQLADRLHGHNAALEASRKLAKRPRAPRAVQQSRRIAAKLAEQTRLEQLRKAIEAKRQLGIQA